MRIIRFFLTLLCSITLSVNLTGCFSDADDMTLTVIAGSELKDIEPKLAEIKKKTGVNLSMKYIGTLDGADAIVSNPKAYDLAWFSHAKYLSLLQGPSKVIHGQEKIGLSPVIPAVKESLAKRWGWINNPNITWAEIAEKANAGEFKYGMTDPSASNSGFSTVMGVQAAFSGSSDVITADSVDPKKLKSFFRGQSLTSGSSGWLAEAYVRDQDKLDGLFNYESILMAMNDSGQLREKLVLIYPKEGVVTADYPLILLDKEKRPAYEKLVTYLKTPEFQTWMMNQTNRRPATPGVKRSEKFPQDFLLELPFPNRLETVNNILFSYLNQYRKPSHSIFVLDVSGSMEGDRIADLRQSLNNLTGLDQSITGKFAQFRDRETVTFIQFNDVVKEAKNFVVNQADQSSNQIRGEISSLRAKGGTAIYDAMAYAYDYAVAARQQQPERFYSIVLMSDGKNTNGSDFNRFKQYLNQNSDNIGGIRTFPILFGNSNDTEMNQLAEQTGGRVFDSRKHSLAQVFKKIRGYQ